MLIFYKFYAIGPFGLVSYRARLKWVLILSWTLKIISYVQVRHILKFTCFLTCLKTCTFYLKLHPVNKQKLKDVNAKVEQSKKQQQLQQRQENNNNNNNNPKLLWSLVFEHFVFVTCKFLKVKVTFFFNVTGRGAIVADIMMVLRRLLKKKEKETRKTFLESNCNRDFGYRKIK